MPDMGIKPASRHKKVSEAAARYSTANLSDALFTTTQQRVLACLFREPLRDYSVSELIEITRAGSGAVQRELARLSGSLLLRVILIGKQKRYRVNTDSPIYTELRGIVQKTFGLSEPLRQAMQPLASKIHAAFVFGSHAKRNDTAESDIDLLVISDSLSYADLMSVLDSISTQLGRTINPTLYTRDEWHQRLNKANAFTARILEQEKLWLIGDENALRA
jgi:predicted nucleotidyltransferase